MLMLPLAWTVAVVEVSMCTSIYFFILRQNNHFRRISSETSYQRRKRENVISFTGHCIHFVLEVILTVSAAVGSRYDLMIYLFFIFGSGLISVVNVAFSRPLRSELGEVWNSFKEELAYFFVDGETEATAHSDSDRLDGGISKMGDAWEDHQN